MEKEKNTIEEVKHDLPHPRGRSEAEKKAIQKYQQKILWWLIGMPTVLIFIFVMLAKKEVDTFNNSTTIKPDTVLFSKILPLQNEKLMSDHKYLQLAALAHMEQESMFRRYTQGGLLLMSRIFVKYFGFLTGMILVILGAVFVVGKLSEDYSSFEGNISEKTKLSFVSSSPGIIFGLFGTLLMLASILQHSDIVIQDRPMYLSSESILAISATELATAKKDTGNVVLDASEADSLFNTK